MQLGGRLKSQTAINNGRENKSENADYPAFENVAIFTPWAEKINLIFPLFFLLFILIDLLWTPEIFKNNIYFSGLSAISGMHQFVTVALIWVIPEMRSWSNERQGQERSWLLLFLLFFVLFFILLQGSAEMSVYTKFLFMLFRFWGIYHVVAQMNGVSAIYNQELLSKDILSESDRNVLSLSELKERRLAYSGMLLTFCIMLLQYFGYFYGILAYVTSVLVIIVTMGYFRLIWKSPMANISNRRIYCIRHFLCVVAPFSRIAIPAKNSYHALEYLFLCGKIKNNSSRTKFILSDNWAVLAFLLFNIFIVIVSKQMIRSHVVSFIGLKGVHAVLAFALSISAIHYWMDGQLFRMKNPSTREKIGGLLLAKKKNLAN